MKPITVKTALLLLTLSPSLAAAATFKVSVEKDASLIRQSYGSPNAAATNFGSALTVDAGSYHHASQGIFGFDLNKIPKTAKIKSARLVLGNARIVGSEPAAVSLGSFWGDWDEKAITWNTRPTNILPISVQNLVNGSNSLDVTQTVRVARDQQQKLLTFTLDAAGSSNVFIASKEDKQKQASYLMLDLDYRPAPQPVSVATHKDASVISRSMAIPNAATTNYGSAATVDAGSYHHQSSALFGFDLGRLPAGRVVRKAVLQLNTSLVGSTPSSFRFGHSEGVWDESSVVVANRPQSVDLFTKDLVSGKNEIDVTAIVAEYRSKARPALTLTVDATGAANAFIVSKEGNASQAATLLVTFD